MTEDSGAFKTNQVNLRQIQHLVTIGDHRCHEASPD
jgi:hypothetical protein